MKGSASLVCVLSLLAAAVLPAVEPVDPSAVAPGSRGVCLTEMDGGELVEIPVTVLGKVGPWAPELDMVLVRLDDPRFEKTGIIAGMSGSPVYVDGRLLGALAYGWGFSREPIAGVTPFVRMLSLASEGSAAAAGAASARPAFPSSSRRARSAGSGSCCSTGSPRCRWVRRKRCRWRCQWPGPGRSRQPAGSPRCGSGWGG